MAFSLIIKQVFNFSDGRTVLAGPVEGDASLIRPGRYGLYRGDELVREVEVEGEMLPKTSPTRPVLIGPFPLPDSSASYPGSRRSD